MKDWIKDNIGKVLTATALLFSVVGFIVDRVIMQSTIVKDVEWIKKELQDANDGVHDLEVLIQNRLLTKPGE